MSFSSSFPLKPLTPLSSSLIIDRTFLFAFLSNLPQLQINMKKVVLKVELYDDRTQTKAMKAVSGLSGVESLSVDKKDNKFTLIGDIDPVQVVRKLKKLCHVEIVSVGPAKEEKKEEPKKEEKKPEEKKKDEKEQMADLLKAHEAYYYNQMRMAQSYPYYHYRTVEEDPNGCVIC